MAMLRASSDAAMALTVRTNSRRRRSNSLRNCMTRASARCVAERSKDWRVLPNTSRSTTATEATMATVKISSRRVRNIMGARLPARGCRSATLPTARCWRFGIRLRGQTDDSVSPQNFNGAFTFGGGLAPVLNAQNQPVLDASGQPLLAPITSIERYRRTLLFQNLAPTQIRALGGGATQFSINAGTAELAVRQVDAGIFAGDEWRVRPNLTLNLGFRYEAQTNIHDWRDFAPRLAVAWAPRGGQKSSRPKTVLRGGFGIFYDRFALSNTLMAQRLNGVVQQQYVVANPDFFPTVPTLALLASFQSTQVIEEISSRSRDRK